MIFNNVTSQYFDWLHDTVCGKWEPRNLSFHSLLMFLFRQDFIPSCEMDESRAEDGCDLRYRFAQERNIPYAAMNNATSGMPCSMLEMMVALSIRIEEHIMADSEAGNRVGQWFWSMIVSLGMAAMDDARFDEGRVQFVIDRFNQRAYQPTGAGGLFTLINPNVDMRKLDIWYQLMAYLNENNV